MTENKRILVIEDEKHIAEGLKLNLSLQGYSVKVAANGLSGIQIWREWQPELIVLDIMLPGIDGISLLQHIRLEDDRIPILVLSAKASADDRVKGLSLGVDDYMTKPFNLDEFLLRVDRLLTRVSWQRERPPEAVTNGRIGSIPSIYKFGTNIIDFEKSTAHAQRGSIDLTGQEMKLLKLFILYKGKPLSRKKLLEVGWGYTRHSSTRTVDNFIVRFRKYFEENPKKPKYFKSMRSIGYRFDPNG